MDFLDVIKSRKSVRSYEAQPIDPDILNEILECGRLAPTGGNLQPWEFIVVTGEATRRKMVDTTYRANSFDLSKHQDWLMGAPVLIAVAAHRVRAVARYGNVNAGALVYQDCAACIENMLLAAVNYGLGACYIYGFMEPLLANVLNLSPEYEALAFISLGYPKGEPVAKPKRPLAEMVHYDQFGVKAPKQDKEGA